MSQSEFRRCLDVILTHEGGTSDDPRDPGGYTRFGISQRAFPSVDIANLSKDLAAEIYRQHYWHRVRGDELPIGIALCVFDSAVNQGVLAAAQSLQRALRVSADGVLGPVTLKAAHSQPQAAVIAGIQMARTERYMRTAGFDTFGRGWLNRVISVAVTAATWAAADAK